jgi:hypothetical protein
MDRVEYQPIVIQDLINLHKSEELDLNPWYQRRSVWTTPQKAYLINTIFESKPIPSVYIRHYLSIESEKSIKEVVDGQQRIRAVLEYADNAYAARHPRHQKRLKYAQLSSADKAKFKMTSLSVGYLIEADDTDVIEIFGRLNSIAKTLNQQEKRNARFSGELKQFALREAACRVQLWRDLGVFTANDIARMNEVQFVSDLAFNMLFGLSDYVSTKLDNFYKEFDEEFPHMEDLSNRMEVVFQRIASLNPKSIKDTIFSRSPIFFTLLIILDSIRGEIALGKLEESLYFIDKIFNSDKPVSERNKDDADFYVACTASTQRIKSRQIRHDYVRRVLGI